MLANSERSAQVVCTTGTEAGALAATDGMLLAGVDAFIPFVSADSGQTLSGAGTLQAYFYDPVVGRWARDSDHDLTVPAGAAGNRDVVFKGPSFGIGIPITASRGRLAYKPNGVTVSGGGVTIQLLAAGEHGIK